MNPEKQSKQFSETFSGNPIKDRKRQIELVSSRSTDELEPHSMTEQEISEAKTQEIKDIQELQKQFQEHSTESVGPIELTPEQESYKEAYLELQRVNYQLGKAETAYMLNEMQPDETLSQEDKDFLENQQVVLRERIAELKEKKIALNLKVHQLEVACQNKNQSTEEALAHKTAKEKKIEHGYAVQNLEHRILTQQEHLDAIRSQRALPKEERKMFTHFQKNFESEKKGKKFTHLQSDSELENEELLFEKLIAKSKRALRTLQDSASPTLKKERLQKEMYLASQALDKHNIKIRKDNTLSYWNKRKIKNNPEARIAWAAYEELEEKIAALPTKFEDTSTQKQSNANLENRKDFHGDETTTEILDEYFSAKNKQDQEIETNRTIPNLETQVTQLQAKRDSLYEQLGSYGVKLKANNTLSYLNRWRVRKNPLVNELWQTYNTLNTQINHLKSENFNIPQKIEAPVAEKTSLDLDTVHETIKSIQVPSKIPKIIEATAEQDSEEYIPSTSNTITGKPSLEYPEQASPENKLLQFRRELVATFPKELQRVTEVAETLRTAYVDSTDTRNAETELTKLAEIGIQQIRELLEENKGTEQEKIAANYLNGIKSLLLAYKLGEKPRRIETTDSNIVAEIKKGIIERLDDPRNLLANVGNFESMMATLKANSPEPDQEDVPLKSSIPTQEIPAQNLSLVSSQDTDQQQTISDTQVVRRIVELEEAIRRQQKVIEKSKNNTDIDSFLDRDVITEEKHQQMKAARVQSREEAQRELDLNIQELARLEKRNVKLREVTPWNQETIDETIVPDNEISKHYVAKEKERSLLYKTRMAYIKMRVAENRQYIITQRKIELQSRSKKLESRIQNVETQIKNLQPSKFKSFFMSAKKKHALAESSTKLNALHNQLIWDKNEIDLQVRSDEEFTIELPQVELDLQLHKADLEHYEEVGVVEDIIDERDRLDDNRREFGSDPGDESEDIPLLDEMIDYMEEISSEYEEAA